MFPSDTEVDQQAVYPTEYLNSLTLRWLPQHKLNIKLGAPVMLLRNIHVDPVHGHCHGTGYIFRHIRARIACIEYSRNVLLLSCYTQQMQCQASAIVAWLGIGYIH